MYSLLCACFGVPPTVFDFEYVDREKNYVNKKNLTPNQFYKEYLGDILDDYVSITNAPTKDKPFNRTYTVDYLGNVLGGSDIEYLIWNFPPSKTDSGTAYRPSGRLVRRSASLATVTRVWDDRLTIMKRL